MARGERILEAYKAALAKRESFRRYLSRSLSSRDESALKGFLAAARNYLSGGASCMDEVPVSDMEMHGSSQYLKKLYLLSLQLQQKKWDTACDTLEFLIYCCRIEEYPVLYTIIHLLEEIP